MAPNFCVFRSSFFLLVSLAGSGLFSAAVTAPANAAQTDVAGPAGSVAFGTTVVVLPNGNFVVTDPTGFASSVGAVYLYSPAGTLISTLTGSSANDQVGGVIVVLTNGDFVVESPYWNNGTATLAGAVTWINGSTGLSGVVSPANSLVGTKSGDFVGAGGVIALSNGSYVVSSPYWGNGAAASAGAVTQCNASSGIVGPVSPSNSLVGTTAQDNVGQAVTVLSNGNYVVSSPAWSNGSSANAGIATWVYGNAGMVGAVSASNSLVGTTADAQVGYAVIALTNGNYVVGSPRWNNGATAHVGAVTWANGITGRTGPVSASNSLVGTTSDDNVGLRVTALSNGNYVVTSGFWKNGSAATAGAATWGSGTAGISGAVSASNSLVGTTANDRIGFFGAAALTNGNYVVQSFGWHNGAAASAGAATWANGSTGLTGPVAASNSLTGTTAGDNVGENVIALSNGNYVVGSSLWQNGAAAGAGAATWANGTTGLTGIVSASNSLVGTSANDNVGFDVAALTNGNYVVASPQWNNGATSKVGAATWANGSTGISGPVSVSNSLIGTTTNDRVSFDFIYALNNGNYVVLSSNWNNGAATSAGAVTWANGSSGKVGMVSARNSLVGTTTNDALGSGPSFTNFSDGNYVILSQFWSNGGVMGAGAATLGSDRFRLAGTIQAYNSVRGTVASGGSQIFTAYDVSRHRLVVGRPAENIVSLFTMDQIFADGFD